MPERSTNAVKSSPIQSSVELVILLPPSEGKTAGGTGCPKNSWHPTTLAILDRIKEAPASKLYPARSAEAAQINSSILQSPTLPALERYSGVVYSALDTRTLSLRANIYLGERLYIASALFGLIRANEPIPNYVLSMNKLRAAQRWCAYNTSLLHDKFVLDLLPQTHRTSVHYTNGLAIDFTYEHNGRIVRAGHEGKRIKGKYVRWLASEGIRTQAAALKFREDGYAWNGSTFHRGSTANDSRR